MKAQIIAILIMTPFALSFIYAGIHEFLRYKSEGRATYGLVFDEETGTTHLTGISEHEEAFDPDDFDPSAYNERDAESGSEDQDKA